MTWGVSPMPNKLIAVCAETGTVVGASYYTTNRPVAFLSALAVRGISATVDHMQASLSEIRRGSPFLPRIWPKTLMGSVAPEPLRRGGEAIQQ